MGAYERKFSISPDAVTLNEFRAMLGGIADGTARKLLRENQVEHFYIRTTYYIPKEKIIDYLLSDHYMKYRFKLKHGIRWVKPTQERENPTCVGYFNIKF